MHRQSGFTLIEVIATMVLVGILASVAAMAVVAGARGYVFAKSNTSITQKSQAASARLSREFKELMDVTTAGANRITFTRLNDANRLVTRTVYLDGSSNAIRIATGSSASGGNALVDNVSSLDFTYFSGGSSWTTAQDVQRLSTVRFSFTMTREDGTGSFTFTNSVTPRNNKNAGGAAPPVERPNDLGYCFVDTVARKASLPVSGLVLALAAAGWLSRRHKAVRAEAAVQDQRGAVLIGLIVTMVLVALVGAALLPMTTTSTFTQLGGQGSMRAYYLAESGYRLAASRYLNASSDSAKDQVLYDLHHDHNGVYRLTGDDGSFDLDVYPYYARTTGVGGGTTLSARLPGAMSPSLSFSTGYVDVNGNMVRYNSVNTSAAPTLIFTKAGNWPGSIGTGATVLFASRPGSTQTVSDSASTLTLENTTGSANTFPVLNGSFRVRGAGGSNTVYTYNRRIDNQLTGIDLQNDPGGTFSISVNDSSDVVLDRFVELHSTGTYGAGTPVESSREVVYFAPIGFVAGGVPNRKVTYHEPFEDLDNWFTGGEDEGQLGTQEIRTVEGDKALAVTGHEEPSVIFDVGEWSILQFSWAGTNANLAAAWEAAGRLLSYDLQVKLRVTEGAESGAGTPVPYYATGMLFRTRPHGENDISVYGLSFMRTRERRNEYCFLGFCGWGFWWDSDDIPDGMVPSGIWGDNPEVINGSGHQYRFSEPAIVLWQRVNGGYDWLAYKVLDNQDIVVNNGRIKNWSTLALRLVETTALPFSNGAHVPLYGEEVRGASSGATGVVNGTPVLSGGTWTSDTAAGVLPLSNVDGTFVVNEQITIGGAAVARTAGTLGSRTNHIRAYYGDTGAHSPNHVPTDNNRDANPRITAGQDIHWPVDNVSEWAAANDYLTLVQWDAYNSSKATRLGVGAEANAIIATSALSSPPTEVDEFTASEIALHATGFSADNVYYDDFAVQLEGAAPSATGFLPPIQK
ncbi:MAG: prepilin-type N-terminal cleavage/methylation domain-containing protein [Desulfatibacillaceae bacterium]